MEVLSSNDKTKLSEFSTEGIEILQKIADYKESLADLTKRFADELGIKPGNLTKALNVKFKDNLADVRDSMTELEEIIEAMS